MLVSVKLPSNQQVVVGPFDSIVVTPGMFGQVKVHEGDRSTVLFENVQGIGWMFTAEAFEAGQATREWLGRDEFDAMVGSVIVSYQIGAR